MPKINWKKLYLDYMDFLGRENDDIASLKTNRDYRGALKEELENTIATNREFYLYDQERYLLKLLRIKLN